MFLCSFPNHISSTQSTIVRPAVLNNVIPSMHSLIITIMFPVEAPELTAVSRRKQRQIPPRHPPYCPRWPLSAFPRSAQQHPLTASHAQQWSDAQSDAIR
jgi:hypothetical protein